MCPNIEVDLHIIDKSQFFIRPFHVGQEDKLMIDRDVKVGTCRFFEEGHVTIFFSLYVDF